MIRYRIIWCAVYYIAETGKYMLVLEQINISKNNMQCNVIFTCRGIAKTITICYGKLRLILHLGVA